MKKTALVMLLALTCACQKSERKYCWKCSTIKTNSSDVFDAANPIRSTQCEKTQSEIDSYEKANTLKITSGNSSKTIESTSCTQQ